MPVLAYHARPSHVSCQTATSTEAPHLIFVLCVALRGPSVFGLRLSVTSVSSSTEPPLLLSGLRSIDLHGNKLTRVDGLQTLHSLRELILDHNILKCLDPGCFASVPRLRRLHLGHNGLRSLAHLSSLTRLQFLHFGANRITEVTELDRLKNLASLTEVWLVDDLVAKKQWYRALLLSKCRQLKVLIQLTLWQSMP